MPHLILGQPVLVTSGRINKEQVNVCACGAQKTWLYQSSSAALCLIEMGAVTELDICHLVRQLGQ